jgi:hypothetical protein
MNTNPLGRQQADQADQADLVIWSYDFSISTFFGCEVQALLPLLPPDGALAPIEAVPGIGLISLTALNFRAGGLDGLLPEFQELIFSVGVTPDLTRGTPNFAMYVVALASTCEAHLRHCRDFYKLPAQTLLTKARVDRDGLAIELGDERGPIASLKSCAGYRKYSAAPEEQLVQAFTGSEPIYSSDCLFRGHVQEHHFAGDGGDVGTLHPHPFFGGLDIDEHDLTPFVQIISDPSVAAEQRYYRSLPWK